MCGKHVLSVSVPENSVAAKSGGCFPGSALVRLKDGRMKEVKDLMLGDQVLAAQDSGTPVYSEFIMFLDRAAATRRAFRIIETKNPPLRITLTAAHLLFVQRNGTLRETYASTVTPGQEIMVLDEGGQRLRPLPVNRVYDADRDGSFAPLTSHGTIVVDDVLASCYAVVQNQKLAHFAFAPVRVAQKVAPFLFSRAPQGEGVHWYADFLYRVGKWILDKDAFHPLSGEDRS